MGDEWFVRFGRFWFYRFFSAGGTAGSAAGVSTHGRFIFAQKFPVNGVSDEVMLVAKRGEIVRIVGLGKGESGGVMDGLCGFLTVGDGALCTVFGVKEFSGFG